MYKVYKVKQESSALQRTWHRQETNDSQLWAARYEGEGHILNIANGIAVDSFGNVYVTGFSGDGLVYDFVTIKYSQP